MGGEGEKRGRDSERETESGRRGREKTGRDRVRGERVGGERLRVGG